MREITTRRMTLKSPLGMVNEDVTILLDNGDESW